MRYELMFPHQIRTAIAENWPVVLPVGSICVSRVDDASRLAYAEILPDERKDSACAFLSRALAFFQAHGVQVERVMTDNGSAYRSHLFKAHIAQAGLKHIRTRPYTPRTNGTEL